ncbi:unnamed protein product [Moneuplotes crassus]|uniref:Uncharacterized protein n=1 Tax=Euplotes crassus TaxID=5936 RepID=A0AAD1UCE5_EUPCR|nr:unnamed protein product [Moneuplotes crassus]
MKTRSQKEIKLLCQFSHSCYIMEFYGNYLQNLLMLTRLNKANKKAWAKNQKAIMTFFAKRSPMYYTLVNIDKNNIQDLMSHNYYMVCTFKFILTNTQSIKSLCTFLNKIGKNSLSIRKIDVQMKQLKKMTWIKNYNTLCEKLIKKGHNLEIIQCNPEESYKDIIFPLNEETSIRYVSTCSLQFANRANVTEAKMLTTNLNDYKGDDLQSEYDVKAKSIKIISQDMKMLMNNICGTESLLVKNKLKHVYLDIYHIIEVSTKSVEKLRKIFHKECKISFKFHIGEFKTALMYYYLSKNCSLSLYDRESRDYLIYDFPKIYFKYNDIIYQIRVQRLRLLYFFYCKYQLDVTKNFVKFELSRGIKDAFVIFENSLYDPQIVNRKEIPDLYDDLDFELECEDTFIIMNKDINLSLYHPNVLDSKNYELNVVKLKRLVCNLFSIKLFEIRKSFVEFCERTNIGQIHFNLRFSERTWSYYRGCMKKILSIKPRSLAILLHQEDACIRELQESYKSRKDLAQMIYDCKSLEILILEMDTPYSFKAMINYKTIDSLLDQLTRIIKLDKPTIEALLKQSKTRVAISKTPHLPIEYLTYKCSIYSK